MHESIRKTQTEASILRETHICDHLDNRTTVVKNYVKLFKTK